MLSSLTLQSWTIKSQVFVHENSVSQRDWLRSIIQFKFYLITLNVVDEKLDYKIFIIPIIQVVNGIQGFTDLGVIYDSRILYKPAVKVHIRNPEGR